MSETAAVSPTSTAPAKISKAAAIREAWREIGKGVTLEEINAFVAARYPGVAVSRQDVSNAKANANKKKTQVVPRTAPPASGVVTTSGNPQAYTAAEIAVGFRAAETFGGFGRLGEFAQAMTTINKAN